MQSIQDRRAQFMALHQPGAAFLMPNPFDTGTAHILEGLRFDALATTSAGYAFSRGLKDAEGLITRDLALSHAEEIVSATTLPVNGDLENGFGDTPEDAAETVRGAIEVGLCGCSIEDYSTDPRHPYYDLELAVERIRAAADMKQRLAPDFVLTARSEAPIADAEHLEKTIERLNAFSKAGADCVYAPELIQHDDIVAALNKLDKPLNVLAGRKAFHMTRKELADMGVARISIGGGLARIAYGAFTAAAEDMKDSGTFGCFDRAVGMHDIDAFLRGRA
ncbi:isocitrate lyase/PEP mutase family protein [Roseibium sp.]|uniref:isocitrate lyase/PEP mutase family protein n=1 Tax=Roseibium sp. TaxID=1936156 RepID=UPI003A97203A